MERSKKPCPLWLVNHIRQNDGTLSFKEYMHLALNHPEHGYYGSDNVRIGPKGDFATSPSLGSDFADLLAIQLNDWLISIANDIDHDNKISLVEFGPGEGDLIYDLVIRLQQLNSKIFKKLEIILVETSHTFKKRQKVKLNDFSHLPIRWKTLDQLLDQPVSGVFLAHEMLDTLPVERLVLNDGQLFRLGVTLVDQDSTPYLEYINLEIDQETKDSIENARSNYRINIPPQDAVHGWTSEWHTDHKKWLDKSFKSLQNGILLIVDYALDASRYYSARRLSGTLISYKNHVASTTFLEEPGSKDITSHICIDTLVGDAEHVGWQFLGEVRQGQALLALGLADRLHSLQNYRGDELAIALSRRESLLRLVDPMCLGEFRWIAFRSGVCDKNNITRHEIYTRFLEDKPSFES